MYTDDIFSRLNQLVADAFPDVSRSRGYAKLADKLSGELTRGQLFSDDVTRSWYTKRRAPSLANMRRICAAFDVRLEWLATGEGKESDSQRMEAPSLAAALRAEVQRRMRVEPRYSRYRKYTANVLSGEALLDEVTEYLASVSPVPNFRRGSAGTRRVVR